MPTPLPAKAPAAAKSERVQNEDAGMLPSGMSVKLERPDPAMTGTLEPGTIVAERYRIDSLLGEGGMGKVYAAEHVHMRKQVAIKVLHAEMSTTPEVVARFEREAVAAGKITHPNVAAATDFGRLEDRSFFLVLEYVAGTDLRKAISKGPLPPERAVHIVRQIAAAVGAAHAAGVVHRDLKPENIMLVVRDGDPDFVKVLDFGIAKIETIGIADPGPSPASGPSAAQPLTKMGAVFGTPDYMSPEQALGQPIDARTDLYSIGVIFFELLAGHRPFKGGAVTLMRAHVLDAVPTLPPGALETLGPKYNAIVQKLLQKSSSDRYASAAELVTALDELSTEAELGPVQAVTALDHPVGLRSSPGLTRSEPAIVAKQRRAFGPLSWLVLLSAGGAALYWLVSSPAPSGDLRNLAASAAPQATAAASAVQSAIETAASATQGMLPPADPTSAAPSDSSGEVENDESTNSPEDTAPAVAASAAPHHLGPHVTQSRPSARPLRKSKPAPPPRHPLIPPPSQWFK
jgi:serine/threonine-protein kinase